METRNTLNAADFYVRVCEQHFERMPLQHVQSELERQGEEADDCTWEGASASQLCGCTEWLALADPPVSVGWDWVLLPNGDVEMNPHSIRTNLMLVDDEHRDLGLAHSLGAVRRRIEQHAWQPVVLAALQEPPSISP